MTTGEKVIAGSSLALVVALLISIYTTRTSEMRVSAFELVSEVVQLKNDVALLETSLGDIVQLQQQVVQLQQSDQNIANFVKQSGSVFQSNLLLMEHALIWLNGPNWSEAVIASRAEIVAKDAQDAQDAPKTVEVKDE
jgi:hypothetical protein